MLRIVYLFLLLSLLYPFNCFAGDTNKQIHIKVLIINVLNSEEDLIFEKQKQSFWTDDNSQIFNIENFKLYYNTDEVAGIVIKPGKVKAALSLQTLLLDSRFDFSGTYFLLVGLAEGSPNRVTVGSLVWATWFIDFDLGFRWMQDEGKEGDKTFLPVHYNEDIRSFKINEKLLNFAKKNTEKIILNDSEVMQNARKEYFQIAAKKAPFISTGSILSSDTYYHGSGYSEEAQYITELYGADSYIARDTEGLALAYVIDKNFTLNRFLSLQVIANFDQGHPTETTLDHISPKPSDLFLDIELCSENLNMVVTKFVKILLSEWEASIL